MPLFVCASEPALEALRWNGEGFDGGPTDWSKAAAGKCPNEAGCVFRWYDTLHVWPDDGPEFLVAKPGDYLTRDFAGRLGVIKGPVFETYYLQVIPDPAG